LADNNAVGYLCHKIFDGQEGALKCQWCNLVLHFFYIYSHPVFLFKPPNLFLQLLVKLAALAALANSIHYLYNTAKFILLAALAVLRS
jgi:hypothetical protein